MNRFLILIALLSSHLLYGQYQQIDQISWGSRARNPIKIEVARLNDNLIFTATNSSYFPYQVELEFKRILNLRPAYNRHTIMVRPGVSPILQLQIVQPNKSFDYTYTTTYRLGNPKDEPDENFPYLIPLTKGTVIKYFEQITTSGTMRFGNVYAVKPGDTLCAMRKGIVTALPDHSTDGDRLQKLSLEILHADGTVAVYQNLNLETFVPLGENVYPGQPLGTIMSNAPVRFLIFRFYKDGKISSIEHKYALNDIDLVSSRSVPEGTEVVHPKAIITKEMTKREIKKMVK